MGFGRLAEFSAPPKSVFWGGMLKFFSTRTKGAPKLSENFSRAPDPFLDYVGSPESKIAEFSPKMQFYRNFWAPNIDLFGWGGRNFFDPHQIGSKALGKIFLVVSNIFLDSVGLPESKIAEFGPKIVNFLNPFWPKFLHVGVRRGPNIFSELQTSWSISQKIF